MSQANQHLGAFIKSTREKRGLTQARLAAETQIPESEIQRIESGTKGQPLNGWHFIQLALALRVYPTQLALLAGDAQERQPNTPLEQVSQGLIALNEFTRDEIEDAMAYIEWRLARAKQLNEANVQTVQEAERNAFGDLQ